MYDDWPEPRRPRRPKADQLKGRGGKWGRRNVCDCLQFGRVNLMGTDLADRDGSDPHISRGFPTGAC